jgi:tetratricopeptide (TPR) repeat protein
LAAGTYGLFLAYGDNESTFIFSNNSTSWGSFFYDPKEDALRVNVKNAPLNESVERLKYEFSNQTDNSAVINLMWEKMKFPFKVEVDLNKTQLESFRRELRSDKGFKADAYVEAVNYCVQNNVNLDEALIWSDYAINGVFVGQKNFKTLSAKASVLNKLNRNAEADVLMKEAMPLATMQELHNYGRMMLKAKKNDVALEAFKLNAQKNPNVFTTNMGLMRGYSATGDYKNALKYAKAAQLQAPDKANKEALDGFVKTLGEGKDIN